MWVKNATQLNTLPCGARLRAAAPVMISKSRGLAEGRAECSAEPKCQRHCANIERAIPIQIHKQAEATVAVFDDFHFTPPIEHLSCYTPIAAAVWLIVA